MFIVLPQAQIVCNTILSFKKYLTFILTHILYRLYTMKLFRNVRVHKYLMN